MCVDYRKINKLQPEVTKADGGKGCISLIPLPKIDELYAKLKGYKVFSSLDLRSGYYHIGLKDSAKPKSAFILSSLGTQKVSLFAHFILESFTFHILSQKNCVLQIIPAFSIVFVNHVSTHRHATVFANNVLLPTANKQADI